MIIIGQHNEQEKRKKAEDKSWPSIRRAYPFFALLRTFGSRCERGVIALVACLLVCSKSTERGSKVRRKEFRMNHHRGRRFLGNGDVLIGSLTCSQGRDGRFGKVSDMEILIEIFACRTKVLMACQVFPVWRHKILSGLTR
jgi:hypothetical protein